jgi:hypothetical protein
MQRDNAALYATTLAQVRSKVGGMQCLRMVPSHLNARNNVPVIDAVEPRSPHSWAA